MSQNKADFFPPKQFPQRVPNPPPQRKPATVVGPHQPETEFEALCDCGCCDFDASYRLYIKPGQIVGQKQLSWVQFFWCQDCGKQIDFGTAKTRGKEEDKQPEGA